jgi:hypothetical protein
MVKRRVLSVILGSVVALCAPSLLFGQGVDGVERVDVFGGYSWYRPGGSIPTTTVDGTVVPGGTLPDFKRGWAGQFTYNLNHWAGIAVDAGGHYNDFGKSYLFGFGPQFRLRTEHFTPFAEALLGAQVLSPKQFPEQVAASFMIGGGVDYRVNSRFSIRPIQADFVNSNYNKLSLAGVANPLNGIRLQAGLVVNFGLPSEESKASASCVADPETVEAGAPVTISVNASGFLPKRTVSYSYESNGGKVSGKANTATVDTTGLAPGSYLVSAKVADNGKGKRRQTAACEAGFKVYEVPKHAPTLAISVQPSSVVAGETATVTANGSSADNRPLSYSCTTSAGRLTGNGPTYTLETAGVAEGTAMVSCTVSDDRNLSATSSASVSVKGNVKVAPIAPKAKEYGAVEFERDAKRPTRVDNEAKGELDRYADALAAAPDAKGVMVGYAAAKEAQTPNKKLPDVAAQRVVNTKDYVTKERGIDPARIEPRTGAGDFQKVELWIVPAGATFPQADTTVVDEAKVKAIPRVALKKRAAHKKAARTTEQ